MCAEAATTQVKPINETTEVPDQTEQLLAEHAEADMPTLTQDDNEQKEKEKEQEKAKECCADGACTVSKSIQQAQPTRIEAVVAGDSDTNGASHSADVSSYWGASAQCENCGGLAAFGVRGRGENQGKQKGEPDQQ